MSYLYATAVLTNIKAKMIGTFMRNSFGSTKFQALLVFYGLFIVIAFCPGRETWQLERFLTCCSDNFVVLN